MYSDVAMDDNMDVAKYICVHSCIQLLLVYDNGDGGGGGDGAASWCLMLDGVRGVLWKLASNTYKFEKVR